MAFEGNPALSFEGCLLCQSDTIALDLASRQSCESGHLTGMRRENMHGEWRGFRVRPQFFALAGKSVQTVGVYDHGCRANTYQIANKLSCLRIAGKARSDDNNRFSFEQSLSVCQGQQSYGAFMGFR